MVGRFFVISIFVFFSCSFSKEKKNDKSFFDFDEVEHYYKDINSGDILKEMKRLNGVDRNSDEYNYLNLIGYNYPNDVNDEKFIDNLLKFNFIKERVDDKFYNKLNKIFTSSTCEDDFSLACAPIYRDILVFYKDKKIVGIAKICFECGKNEIIGAKTDTSFFGQCGGYGRLYKILKSK